jgi:hypothetical protein
MGLLGGGGRRFSGRREVAIGLGVYALYLLVRHLALRGDGRGRADRNAERIVAFERGLGLHVEPELQRMLLPYRRVIHGLNLGYAVANVGLTVGWLMRLYFTRHPEYHRYRRATVMTTLLAQPFFLFLPTAPPRSRDHLVDTILEVSGIDLDSGVIAKLYHPLAAMPSIHVAYAVVTSSGLAATSRSPAVRRLAPGYPPLVSLVVLVTANHYVLDAVVGAAVGVAGLRLSRGRAAEGRPPEPPPG